jgi:hypothetical protein
MDRNFRGEAEPSVLNHLIRAGLVILLACSTHALAGRAPDAPGCAGFTGSPAIFPLSPMLQPVADPSGPWPAFDRAASLEDEDDDQRSPSTRTRTDSSRDSQFRSPPRE